MSVDFTKIKQKKEAEARKVAERNARNAARHMLRWKPRVGENRIRILPPWTSDETNPNANSFEREVHQHWGVLGEDGPPITCPLKTPHGVGAPPVEDGCDICVEVDRLRATKDPADSELAKVIRAKGIHMSNIVDLKDPVYTQKDFDTWEEENPGVDPIFQVGDTKVQIWSYGPTLYKEFLDIFADGNDITNLDTGHNVFITREGTTRENTKYRMRIDINKSAFVPKQVDLKEKLYDLDLLVQYKSNAEIKALLEQSGSGEVSERFLEERPAPRALPKPRASVEVDTDTEAAEEVEEVKTQPKKPAKAKASGQSVADLEAQMKAALKQ